MRLLTMGVFADIARSRLRRGVDAPRRDGRPPAPPRRKEAESTVVSPPVARDRAGLAATGEEARQPPKSLGAEATYHFHERVGIGLDNGMSLADAEDIAMEEALLVDIPSRLAPAATKAVRAWGLWDVEAVEAGGWTGEGVTLDQTPLAAKGLTTTKANPPGGSGKESKEATP